VLQRVRRATPVRGNSEKDMAVLKRNAAAMVIWYKADIGLPVKSFLIPLTNYTMAPDFDKPMDREGEG
jgi:hypothetical protein